MPLEFVESEKGHKKLMKDGHTSYRNGANDERIYWNWINILRLNAVLE